MKVHYLAYALLATLFLSACRSSQQVTLSAGFKGPNELSRLYGFRLTPKDNIFLYNEGAKWLGTPHRLGGKTKRGVDCSGFTGIIYREIYSIQLLGSSVDILKNNCKKVSRSRLREGDLVFFNTNGNKKKTPSHVGIYLKDGYFIHTSTSSGVVVSSLKEPYYIRTWLTGGRVK